MNLLAWRLSRKEIAERRHLSSETVKTHTRTLYQKLDARGRREGVAKRKAAGLIGPPE